MAMARSLTGSSLGSLHLPPRCSSHYRIATVSTSKLGYGFLATQGTVRMMRFNLVAKMSNGLQPAAPNSPKPNLPNWVVSFLLSIVSLVFPGWKTQLQTFLKLEDEMEKVVEDTAEAIENIADATDKVIEEVERDLPADSKLKGALSVLENATEKAEKDAKLAIDLINKVDKIKEEVETIVEPIINPVEYEKKKA